MREYELVYIIDPDLAEESVAGLIERFQNLAISQGAEILKLERWEKRRLAYEIKRKREGIYVVMEFTGTPAADELNRILRITDGVLRHLIVLADPKKYKQAPTAPPPTNTYSEPPSARPSEPVGDEAPAPVDDDDELETVIPEDEDSDIEGAVPGEDEESIPG